MRPHDPSWKPEEINILLEFLKKNNYMAIGNVNEVSGILETFLKPLGVSKSAIAIKQKLKYLRVCYVICKKKNCSPLALEECPHFELLDAIYKNANLDKIDGEWSLENGNSVSSTSWPDEEIRQMLLLITTMNLAKELSLSNSSPLALSRLQQGLTMAGYPKDIDQIESILMDLRRAYTEQKIAGQKDVTAEPCPHYNALDKIWGTDDVASSQSERKPEKINENSSGNSVSLIALNQNLPWTHREISTLLNIIDEMKLYNELKFRVSIETIKKLVAPLKNRGYNRTSTQIMDKFSRLRLAYLRCIETGRQQEQIQQFPYFDRFDNMFARLQPIRIIKKSQVFDKKDEKSNTGVIKECIVLKKSILLPIDSNIDKNTNLEPSNDVGIPSQNNDIRDVNNLDTQQASSMSKSVEPSTHSQLISSNKHESPSSTQVSTPVVKEVSNQESQQPTPPIFKSGPFKLLKLIKQDSGNQIFITPYKDSPSTSSAAVSTPPQVNNDNPSMSSSSGEATFLPPSPSTFQQSQSATESVSSAVQIMEHFHRHEERLQQQNFLWMEKMFEMQKKHEREHRELLLSELKEVRKMFGPGTPHMQSP